jgi:hypothetical protein
MIKIGFPRDFSQLKVHFPEKEKERDLYIVAEDTETSKMLGAIRFFYQKNRVDIYENLQLYQGEQYPVIFDGMIRTLLYKMAEEECTMVAVHHVPEELEKYFCDHDFTQEAGVLVHQDFPDEFFKPCPGCSEK